MLLGPATSGFGGSGSVGRYGLVLGGFGVVGWAEFGKQARYRRKTAVFVVRHVHIRCRTWTALHVG